MFDILQSNLPFHIQDEVSVEDKRAEIESGPQGTEGYQPLEVVTGKVHYAIQRLKPHSGWKFAILLFSLFICLRRASFSLIYSLLH